MTSPPRDASTAGAAAATTERLETNLLLLAGTAAGTKASVLAQSAPAPTRAVVNFMADVLVCCSERWSSRGVREAGVVWGKTTNAYFGV